MFKGKRSTNVEKSGKNKSGMLFSKLSNIMRKPKEEEEAEESPNYNFNNNGPPPPSFKAPGQGGYSPYGGNNELEPPGNSGGGFSFSPPGSKSQNQGNFGFKPPQNNFSPPQNNFKPPQNNFKPPQNNFKPPQNNFKPPQNNFKPPQNNFKPPTNNFHGNNFDEDEDDYSPPQQTYRPPQHDVKKKSSYGFKPPTGNFGGSNKNLGNSNFETPKSNFTSPGSGFRPPMPADKSMSSSQKSQGSRSRGTRGFGGLKETARASTYDKIKARVNNNKSIPRVEGNAGKKWKKPSGTGFKPPPVNGSGYRAQTATVTSDTGFHRTKSNNDVKKKASTFGRNTNQGVQGTWQSRRKTKNSTNKRGTNVSNVSANSGVVASAISRSKKSSWQSRRNTNNSNNSSNSNNASKPFEVKRATNVGNIWESRRKTKNETPKFNFNKPNNNEKDSSGGFNSATPGFKTPQRTYAAKPPMPTSSHDELFGDDDYSPQQPSPQPSYQSPTYKPPLPQSRPPMPQSKPRPPMPQSTPQQSSGNGFKPSFQTSRNDFKKNEDDDDDFSAPEDDSPRQQFKPPMASSGNANKGFNFQPPKKSGFDFKKPAFQPPARQEEEEDDFSEPSTPPRKPNFNNAFNNAQKPPIPSGNNNFKPPMPGNNNFKPPMPSGNNNFKPPTPPSSNENSFGGGNGFKPPIPSGNNKFKPPMPGNNNFKPPMPSGNNNFKPPTPPSGNENSFGGKNGFKPPMPSGNNNFKPPMPKKEKSFGNFKPPAPGGNKFKPPASNDRSFGGSNDFRPPIPNFGNAPKPPQKEESERPAVVKPKAAPQVPQRKTNNGGGFANLNLIEQAVQNRKKQKENPGMFGPPGSVPPEEVERPPPLPGMGALLSSIQAQGGTPASSSGKGKGKSKAPKKQPPKKKSVNKGGFGFKAPSSEPKKSGFKPPSNNSPPTTGFKPPTSNNNPAGTGFKPPMNNNSPSGIGFKPPTSNGFGFKPPTSGPPGSFGQPPQNNDFGAPQASFQPAPPKPPRTENKGGFGMFNRKTQNDAPTAPPRNKPQPPKIPSRNKRGPLPPVTMETKNPTLKAVKNATRQKHLRDSINGLKNLASFWDNFGETNKKKQEMNPFSEHFAGKREVAQGNIMGSKSEQRAKEAQEWTNKEIDKLITVIKDFGHTQSSGSTMITFGELFLIYENISDTLVFMLLKAKKRGRIHFDAGEMLLQGRDDHVEIYVY